MGFVVLPALLTHFILPLVAALFVIGHVKVEDG